MPLLAACADSYGALSLDPSAGPPLGVGLVEQFRVDQVLCESGIDGSCDPTNPPHLAVRVGSGSAVAIANVDQTTATFGAQGAAEGSGTVVITGGDDVTIQRTIDVVALAQTMLTVSRDTGSPVYSPVRAFTNASVTIDQANLGAGGTAVAGKAPLVASSGLVAVSGDVVTTAATPGSVQITAALATLELDVVDPSMMADFSIDGSRTDQVILYTSTGTIALSLLATDANGLPIVGGGPEPTFSIADPSIFGVTGGSGSGNTRELDVQGYAGGNTTMQVTWGQVTKTFAISVVAR
ncbi:MAG: hypothetical protein ACM31C_16405 [Acidobacteriota bacterium]